MYINTVTLCRPNKLGMFPHLLTVLVKKKKKKNSNGGGGGVRTRIPSKDC